LTSLFRGDAGEPRRGWGVSCEFCGLSGEGGARRGEASARARASRDAIMGKKPMPPAASSSGDGTSKEPEPPRMILGVRQICGAIFCERRGAVHSQGRS